MDETSELERRLISEAPTLDINRDDNGRTVIRGYAAVYQSDSKNLGGFVERLSEGCFDDVLASNPDVFARFNHSDDMILGRTTAGTLRLFADEKGLRYEIDPPRSAAGLVESLERGDIRNSSFAFRVKPQDEAWTRDATGMQIRTINRIDSLHDVAVVANPAYSAAEAFVSKRALSMVTPADESPVEEAELTEDRAYENIDFTPPAGVRAEAQKGLDWRSEYGRGGTEIGIARGRDLSNGTKISPKTAKRMKAYFDRHEVDKQGEGYGQGEPGYPSNGRIAWALWGGDPGYAWAKKLVQQMEPEDTRSMEAESLDLTPAHVALHEATEAIAEAVGKWPQSGPNGAHYMPESPFAATGMRCANCVMYEGGGRCEAVEGEIEADGVCKLWVIPAGKLDMTRSIALSKAAGLNALLLSNALHQSTGKR